MPAFGQNHTWPTKIRIWPGHFRDRIWPKPHLTKKSEFGQVIFVTAFGQTAFGQNWCSQFFGQVCVFKISRRPPRERKGREKKARNFGPLPTTPGPNLSGPPPLRAPNLPGPQPEKIGQVRSNKIGQVRPNKVGQMRPIKFGQMWYWPNVVATERTHCSRGRAS